jgi:hypothetical protein
MNDQQEWFEYYDEKNPQIYEFFKKYTLTAIRKGHKNLSAEFIFNAIRWESDVKAEGEFKINNNAKPFYARKFMKEFPHYNGFFRKRHSKAD